MKFRMPDDSVIEIAHSIIKIGRGSGNALNIDDRNCSRMHAVIERVSEDEAYILDTGSYSGTYVNGKKINKSPLKKGDAFVIGSTRIIVEEV